MQGIDLQRKGKELAAELDYYVKSHFEQLVEQFVDCFSEYCNKIYEMPISIFLCCKPIFY